MLENVNLYDADVESNNLINEKQDSTAMLSILWGCTNAQQCFELTAYVIMLIY